MSKKVVASFIGINAYAQSPLSGCIKDVLGFDLFLREHISQQIDTAYHPLYFLAPNKADEIRLKAHRTAIKTENFPYEFATFKSITEKAFAHFKQAKAGDTCILYYSGHGSQADAPEEFWHTKPDKQNETIVCVDSRDPQSSEARDIIDKELAYLLWDALPTNVHCLVIMDCCHSGNNTRAFINNEKTGTRFRFIPSSKNKIPLQQYIGFDKNFYTIHEKKASIKIAKYVHFAAARDSEKALESSGGGLFSYKLLEVLRSGGTAKSYRDLMQGLAITVSNRASQQNPVAFARDEADLDLRFLGGAIIPYQPSYEVRFDFEINKWVMYGGLIHNINPSSGKAKTTIKIIETATEIDLQQVNNTQSILNQTQTIQLDKSAGYRAIILRLANPPVIVGLSAGLLSNQSLLQQLKNAYATTSHLFFQFDFGQQPSTFYLACLSSGNEFVLAKADSLVPLLAGEEIAIRFVKNIDAFCKWQSVLDLKNTNTSFTKDDFVFTVETVEGKDLRMGDRDSVHGEINQISPGDETVLNYVGKQQPGFRFSIQIKNQLLQSCFIGVLYLDSQFGIENNFANNDNNRITNYGTPLYLSWIDEQRIERTLIPVKLNNSYLDFNISEITDFVKIFVSKKRQNFDVYKQQPLSLWRGDKGVRLRAIGLEEDIDADGNAEDKSDWTVFTFPLRIVRSKKEVKLEAGQRASFSAFEVKVPVGFSANAFAATGNDVQRKLATKRGMDESDNGIEQFILPPEGIWGNVVTDPSPFSSGISSSSDNGIRVLELFPDQTDTELKEGSEILIIPKKEQLRAMGDEDFNETIIPFGYDTATGLYFPLGYTDELGTVHIQQLPSITPGILKGEVQLTRSVGGSIKLFFKKIFSRKKLNTLSLYELKQGEPWEKITEDPAAIKPIMEKNKGVPVILVIHGILGDTNDIVGSLQEIEAFPSVARFVLAYDYENLSTPISKIAGSLRNALSVAGFGDGTDLRLSIVAHSMGGLVSRCLVEKEGGSTFVKQIIFAGTPNAGSELGDLRSNIFGLISHALNVTGPLKYALTGLSFLLKKKEHNLWYTLNEMTPDSPFLTILREAARPANVAYSLIAGNTLLLENGYTGEDFYLRKISDSLKQKLLYPGLSKMLFSGKPNDMAVKVESMKTIKGLQDDDIFTVANDHISYFSEPDSWKIILKLLADQN